MSELDAYGVGTIGIVSYRQTAESSKQSDYDHQHAYDIRVRSVGHGAALT